MSNSSPVSDKIIAYLIASSEDDLYKADVIFDLHHASYPPSRDSLEMAIVIARCIDNRNLFLIGALSDLTSMEEGGSSKFSYTVRPVETFLEFIEMKKEELPVFDEVHIGPFDAEGALKMLELVQTCYQCAKMQQRADFIRYAFRQAIETNTPNVTSYTIEKSAMGGVLIRPAAWERSPSSGP